MSIGARVFVAFVYTVLGLSFVATTAVLYYEFRDTEWFSLALIYSHLFVFFPIFGIVGLFAFYLPSAVFLDMYWNHVSFGRLRFLVGFVVVAAASYFVSQAIMKGDTPAIWQVPAPVLLADRGNPPGCGPNQSCIRANILQTVRSVRKVSQNRIGLSPFVRECEPDFYLEMPPELLAKRFCFVTQTRIPAAECCKAQERFSKSVAGMYQKAGQESLTGRLHTLLLPLKVFFLLILLLIGMLLVLRRRMVVRFYGPMVSSMERDLIVGATVMLIWPVMNHAFLQSASVMYGSFGRSLYAQMTPVFSVLFGAWALMLLFFFFRRFEKDSEAAVKIIGVIASAVAVIKYDAIIDFGARFLGSGSNYYTLGGISVFAVVALVSLFPGRKPREGTDLVPTGELKEGAVTEISIEKPSR